MRERPLELALVAMFIALVVVLRVFKHVYFGAIQFINLPAVITFTVAILLGPRDGAVVGFLSYIVSDLFLAMSGPWSVVDGALLAILAVGLGHVLTPNNIESRMELMISVYLAEFIFDILSSWLLLFIIVGGSLMDTLALSLLGLFIPLSGGIVFGIGPITEFCTAFLVAMVLPRVNQLFQGVNIQ